MCTCHFSRNALGPRPAVVGRERHPEEVPELAVEVGDPALRPGEQRHLHVAERRQPLDEQAQGDTLADAGLAGDQRKAPLAGEGLDAPAEMLHPRRQPQGLRRHVGRKGIPLESVEGQQLRRHQISSSSTGAVAPSFFGK